MDFNDTFLSLDHLKTAFPHHEVVVATEEDIVSLVKPPFRLTFPELEKDEDDDEEEEEEKAKAEKKGKKGKKKKKQRGGKKEEGEPAAKAAKLEKDGGGDDDKREEGEIVEEEAKEEEPLPVPRVAHKPKPKLIVEPYEVPSRGPYPFLHPKKNSVPFTPTQVR